MTLLVRQIGELDRELDLLLAGDDNRKTIEEMESLLSYLDDSYTNTIVEIANRRLILEFPDSFSLGAELDLEAPLRQQLFSCYTALVDAWKNDRKEVRQSGVLGAVIEAADLYRQRLFHNSNESWATWVDKVARETSIADAQLESIKNVPEYVLSIQKYRSARESFEANSKKIPADRDALLNLFALVETLKSIKGNLKFDLPTKVLKFFDALDRFGAFPLKDFDSEVSDWLAQNDGLKDLSITRRGVRRF